MLDTFKIYNELKEQFGQEGAAKLAEILGEIYTEIANTVTREDFQELKLVVAELAEAQRSTETRLEELAKAQQSTEKRLGSLTEKVESLAEAQQKAEKRLESLTKKVGALAEAQQKTEKRLESLTKKVESLAEAQQKTEKRLESLTKKVEALAEAQRKTEATFEKVIRRVDNIEQTLGGISNTIGYQLEDESYPVLKRILKKQFNIDVEQLYRRNIVYSHTRFDEINIYGEASENGRKIFVIGESKAQFGPRDVDRFLKLLKRVKDHLPGKIFPLAIAYHFHPKAEEKLEKQNIPFFWSYQLTEKK